MKYILNQLGFNFSNVINCTSCLLSKSQCLLFNLSENHTSTHFHLIHSNLWGPTSISSFSGYRDYICFVDDFTKFTWIYLLKHKSEAYNAFVSFEKMVHTQFDTKIKIFRNDNGKEFINSTFG